MLIGLEVSPECIKLICLSVLEGNFFEVTACKLKH